MHSGTNLRNRRCHDNLFLNKIALQQSSPEILKCFQPKAPNRRRAFAPGLILRMVLPGVTLIAISHGEFGLNRNSSPRLRFVWLTARNNAASPVCSGKGERTNHSRAVRGHKTTPAEDHPLAWTAMKALRKSQHGPPPRNPGSISCQIATDQNRPKRLFDTDS